MRRALLVTMALCGIDCSLPKTEPPLAPVVTLPADPIVIVTIDGVRWQEIFEGTDPILSERGFSAPSRLLVPNIRRIGARGALLGAPGYGSISATGPEFLSLPGYTEIMTGAAPIDCANNECARTKRPTILDLAHDRGASVAGFASWERLDLALSARPGTFLTNCGRGNPPTPQFSQSEDSRPDRLTAAAALSYYRAERPDVFYLGLGDTDELAHEGDYPGYLAALHDADDVIGKLLAILDADDRGRRTTIVVSPDHGRAHSFWSHGGYAPEAGRVWMAISGPRIQARGYVKSRDLHLADLAPTLRTFLGIPLEDSPIAGSPIAEAL